MRVSKKSNGNHGGADKPIPGFEKIFGNGNEADRNTGIEEWYNAYFSVIKNQVRRSGILNIDPINDEEDLAHDAVINILPKLQGGTLELENRTDRGMKGYSKKIVLNLKTNLLRKFTGRIKKRPEEVNEPSDNREQIRFQKHAKPLRSDIVIPCEDEENLPATNSYIMGWRADKILQSRESLGRIKHCIASASPKYRTVMELRSQERNTKEIAKALNIAENTVGIVERRARMYLAKHVGDICPTICKRYM